MRGFARIVSASVVILGLLSSGAEAQDSKSAGVAKQLAAALEEAKLDSIAAKDPANPDVFVAALYFAGSQLLVVSAKYSVPPLMQEKLAKKEYREVYIDLTSASVPESKIFVQDLGADGLKAKRGENEPYDIYEPAGKPFAFDSDWKKAKISEDEYMKVFGDADERYAEMLSTLLAHLKKPS